MKEYNVGGKIVIPTQEQLDIIEHVKSGKDLKVVAIAGASKTSTLVMVANEVVKPILYMTFNKAMQEDARDKFPSWVEVRTTHSMAYQAVGYQYQSKLKRPVGRYLNVCGTASEVAKYFKVSPLEYIEGKWITSAAIGYAILQTVRNFEQSDSSEIGKSHISYAAFTGKDMKKMNSIKKQYEKVVFEKAKALWALRVNTKSKILAEHDTYAKLWQLSEPDLSEYEIIMVDEFHDTNMCLVDVLKQQEVQKIVVGDPAQSIYQFRGAINALEEVDFPVLTLSKSFRYGQSVADVAQKITGNRKMFGWEELKTETRGTDCRKFPETYTAIYRTNSAMLEDAVQKISEGKRVNIEADIRDFTNLIWSAIALKNGEMNKVKHTSLLVYDSWGDLQNDIEWASSEIQRVVAMIESGTVYKVVGFLKAHKNTDDPEITYITGHKSKGMEYPNVIIGDDFPSVYDDKGKKRELPEAERNLLYVACTRAKDLLIKSQSVEDYEEVATGNSSMINTTVEDLCGDVARGYLNDGCPSIGVRKITVANDHWLAHQEVASKARDRYFDQIANSQVQNEEGEWEIDHSNILGHTQNPDGSITWNDVPDFSGEMGWLRSDGFPADFWD